MQIPVNMVFGFDPGDDVTIDKGTDHEETIVIDGFDKVNLGAGFFKLKFPLKFHHDAGAPMSTGVEPPAIETTPPPPYFPAPFPDRFPGEAPNKPIGPFAPTMPPTTPNPFMSMFGAGPAPGPAPAPAMFGFGTTRMPYAMLDLSSPDVEMPSAPLPSQMMPDMAAQPPPMSLPMPPMGMPMPPMGMQPMSIAPMGMQPMGMAQPWGMTSMSFLQTGAQDMYGSPFLSDGPVSGCNCQCTKREAALVSAQRNAIEYAAFPEDGEPAAPWER